MEPDPKQKPLDSQMNREAIGANSGTRTHDLLFTKQLLYQLSYVGNGGYFIIKTVIRQTNHAHRFTTTTTL